MYFLFVIKTRQKSLSREKMVKSHKKKCQKYYRMTTYHRDFEEILYQAFNWKIDRFDDYEE